MTLEQLAAIQAVNPRNQKRIDRLVGRCRWLTTMIPNPTIGEFNQVAYANELQVLTELIPRIAAQSGE